MDGEGLFHPQSALLFTFPIAKQQAIHREMQSTGGDFLPDAIRAMITEEHPKGAAMWQSLLGAENMETIVDVLAETARHFGMQNVCILSGDEIVFGSRDCDPCTTFGVELSGGIWMVRVTNFARQWAEFLRVIPPVESPATPSIEGCPDALGSASLRSNDAAASLASEGSTGSHTPAIRSDQ